MTVILTAAARLPPAKPVQEMVMPLVGTSDARAARPQGHVGGIGKEQLAGSEGDKGNDGKIDDLGIRLRLAIAPLPAPV